MEKNPMNAPGNRDPSGGAPNGLRPCRSRDGWNSIIPWLRLALGLLFVFSGASKAWDPSAFAGDIANYRLTPWALTAAAALYLPWLEIVAGAGLLFCRTRGGALLILSALLVVFCGALASAWLRNLNIHCGCFGGGGSGVSLALARNLVLLAACAIIARAGRRAED